MSKNQLNCKNCFNKIQNTKCINQNEALLNYEKNFESLSISITQDEINDLQGNNIITNNENNRQNDQNWQVNVLI
jgi:hypothetical protein